MSSTKFEWQGVKDEESTSRLSDGDTTEDETARESDDTSLSGNITNVPTPTPFTESIPSSPVSHWCVNYPKLMYMYFSCWITEKELHFVFKHAINAL